mgnify:CR=1 FL=1
MTEAGIESLVRQLADGRFHSGENLARLLGVSRTAVWKRIRKISRDTGLDIHAVRGKGYRLALPLARLPGLDRRHVQRVRLVVLGPAAQAVDAGVRAGRKTYLVDLAGGVKRTDYVSVSNTLIGLLLLVVGGVTSLFSWLAPEVVILGLSLFGLAGAGLARTLPEVE